MIEQLVAEIREDVRKLAELGQMDARTLQYALDAHQRFIDYLDSLLDGGLVVDPGTSIDSLAENLAERME